MYKVGANSEMYSRKLGSFMKNLVAIAQRQISKVKQFQLSMQNSSKRYVLGAGGLAAGVRWSVLKWASCKGKG